MTTTPAIPPGYDPYAQEICELTLRSGKTMRVRRQVGSSVRLIKVTDELNGRYVEMVKGAKRARKKYTNRIAQPQ
jgi:hypothetical protein